MKQQDLEKGLMSCVHCGFCLDACPTYRETGDEADSPRGRIVLMRRVQEGQLSMADPQANEPGGVGYHLDRCLGCRACETACPSGVPYGLLLEHFRDRQESETRRPLGENVLRTGLLETLTDPGRMALALKAGKLTGGKIPAPVAKFLGLPANTKVPIPENLEAAAQPVPVTVPPQGDRRGKVALLAGCVMRVLYAPVHHSTVRVLSLNGIEVHTPKQQGCCGALHGHQGKLDTAKQLARETIATFENGKYDAIILNSAGCGSFLKDYKHLLRDDPEWADRARAFSDKVKDVTEYLAEIKPVAMTNPLRMRITYHDACHLCHGQKISQQPRELLKMIPGATFVETADSDQCCGSAGVYNYLQPEMARSLLKKKIDNLLAARADVIATGNPGCLAWIEQGLQSGMVPSGARIPKIVHPIELIDQAYRR
ncbi:MAG: glycolate oxidase subunit GlcF [Armatimonadaceae bacterium]